jgi:hypothetical protein
MNLKLFSIALMASAIPFATLAQAGIKLDESDFLSAQRIQRNGDTIVSVKLSKSGKAKLRKLSHNHVSKEVHGP